MDATMKQILFDIANESDFEIEVMETDKDHVHLLLDYPPKLSMASIVNRLKSMSTNRIWKQKVVDLKKVFWAENTFWSDGYFCCSTGDASTDTIRQYIEEQG
jgi:putative transposase